MAEKVVLITGGASGIGLAAAKRFATAEASLVMVDVNEEAGQEAASSLAGAGHDVLFFPADVSDLEQVARLFRELKHRLGRLDVAVNNAGIGGVSARTADYPAADWNRVLAVNLTAVFYCMQQELHMMSEAGAGSIVNVASIAGIRGLNFSPAYTASKHGVVGLTRAAALEYARRHIRINAVCPVFTRTPLFEQMFEADPSLEEKLLRNIPMRRYGTPEDIAEAIYWLASPAAAFVTGQAIPLDGGMTA